MSGIVLYVVLSGVVLLLLLTLYVIEDVKGKRIFLRRPRFVLDCLVEYVYVQIISGATYFVGRVFKFLLHHGIQTLLKNILKFVKSFEGKLENTLRQQKRGARNDDEERVRNYLDDIADHKESSALTDRQKKKLRSQL